MLDVFLLQELRYLKKCFINIGRGRDQRCLPLSRTTVPNPVEGIAPAILLELAAPGFLKHIHKMDCFPQVNRISSHLIKKRETHGVMRVGDGEPHAVMKQAARRWQERFTKDHRSNGSGPDKAVSVIERLGAPADWASIKALKIPGGFTVSLQPFGEVRQNF